MRLNERKIYFSYLVAVFLFGSPLAYAQELTTKNTEARGLLKRLESYENKYLASPELVIKEKPAVKVNKSDVMAKQQEVLVSEVLRLRSQVSQLESQIAQGQEAADFSEEEQKLISELTRERKRGDDLELELAEEKAKDFTKLNRELENTKSSIVTERQRADKKEQLLKEITEKVKQLEEKLAQQQELKKSYTKAKNESEQLQLQLEAQKGLDTDNEFLRKSLAEEKQKSSDLIRKSKEIVQRISTLEENLKSKKINSNKELENKINEYEKKISLLNKSNESKVTEKSELEEQLTNYKKELKELKDKEIALKDSLKLTAENAKKSVLTNERYTKQIAELEKQMTDLEQQSNAAKGQIETLSGSATELTSLKGQHSVLATEVSQCQGQLKAEEEELERLKSVERELIAVRNELLLKNTAAELLATGPSRRQREIRAKASQSVQEQTMDSETQKKYLETKLAFENAQKALAGETAASSGVTTNGEARVLTVVGSKVNLRNGPGMDHSPVMQISEGTKLTMETKEGEWYRVYTPTGSRAYIHQDEVSSNDSEPIVGSRPAKAPLRGDLVPFGKVKVAGAIDTEDLAIRKLKAGMGSNE